MSIDLLHLLRRAVTSRSIPHRVFGIVVDLLLDDDDACRLSMVVIIHHKPSTLCIEMVVIIHHKPSTLCIEMVTNRNLGVITDNFHKFW
jgi:hypothetical protein